KTRVMLGKRRAARGAGDHPWMFSIAVERLPEVVAVEAVLAVAVLFVVPFFAGSARTEAGSPSARSFDHTVFGTGVVLVGLVAMGLWVGTRESKTGERVAAKSSVS